MNKENKKIEYIQILKDAWQIVWENKYFWWFGFFIVLGGGSGFNFQLPMDEGGWNEKTETGKEEISSFLNNYFEWIIAGLVIIVAIAIILMILRIISQAAIIKSTDDIQKGRVSSFSIGFKKGRKYFWKLFGINLIFGFLFLGLIIVLFLPVAFLFYEKSYIAAVLLAILALFILIPLAVLFAFLKKYAYFYLVLTKLSVRRSIESAYQVFCKNILASLIMALLLLAIGIMAGIAVFILILFLVVVFLFAGLMFYLAFAKLGIFIIAALGALAFILIIFLFSSVREAFFQTAWLLFFKEIAAIKIEEADKVEAKIAAEKTVSSNAERAAR